MADSSSKPQASKSSSSSARKRAPNVIGAVAGAVIGGVLGAIIVKKVRDGSAKRLVPTKVPPFVKRGASAIKTLAQDAKIVAQATAVVAADAALQEVSKAAQQFMVDVVSGQSPKPPERPAPTAGEPNTPIVISEQPAVPNEDSRKKGATAKGQTTRKPAVPKKSAGAKKPGKSAKPAATRKPL